MNQFISTYRKDYAWPYVRSMSIRAGPVYATDVKPPRKSCLCSDKTETVGDEKKAEAREPASRCEMALIGDAYEWSRLGPMGPLMDPKLYPAKPIPMPRFEPPKCDRPEEHIKELEQKYPYLYGILQCAPPNELFHSVDKNRLKSTYQQDFGDAATGPFAHRDYLLTAAGMDGPHLPACRPTNCAERARQIALNDANETDRKADRRQRERRAQSRDEDAPSKRRKRNGEAGGETKASLPPWKSEYQNVIAKTGEVIMKYDMHNKKRRDLSRAKPYG